MVTVPSRPTPPASAGTGLEGLSSAEASARLRRGEGNRAVSGSARTYGRILHTNVFNFYNSILFTIGAALLVLGRYGDAFISAAIGLLNAVISAVQEIRAKRQLDRLQQRGRSPVLVVRDGREVEVPPEEVVRGDLLRVRAGILLVVDGPVLDGVVEVDESLLTGEPGVRRRGPGEDLLAGSRCVGGTGLQRARDVGAASRAGRLTAEARRGSTDATPLQRQIAFCVRLVMVLVVLMTGAILLEAALEGMTLVRVVQTTAVLSGLVPYGLFFLIVLAYTAGAVTASRRGALVQRVNAIESVSNVDVLCTGTTGTLTTGELAVVEVLPVDGQDLAAVSAALSTLARSTTGSDRTSAALAAHLPGAAVPVLEEVPATSDRGWRGVRTGSGSWVLGSPAALAAALRGPDLDAEVGPRTAQGQRVLVLARAVEPAAALSGPDGAAALPALHPLAVVALAEELRPEVPETLARLRADGIEVKVLSAEGPAAAAAVATRAGLPDVRAVHGDDLDSLDGAELDAAVATGTVFGGLGPEQKERVVTALRRQGRYVAVVGDGIGDVRALAAAQVGVALRRSSPVAHDVADIVLVEDSLAALLPARREGRRIISGIALSTQVFLTRVATQALVIVTVTMLGLGFPYSPAQTGLTLFTVGLPTLFLTAWARPAAPDRHLLLTLARFVLPAAVVTSGFAVGIYAFLYTLVAQGFDDPVLRERLILEFERYTGLSYGLDADFTEAAATIGAQTGLSTFVSLASILLILFLEPPGRWFAAWTRPVGDRRPAVLVAGLLVALLTALVVPQLRDYFGLTRPAGIVYAIVLPVLVLWFLTLATVYRLRLLDRVLGLPALLSDGGVEVASAAPPPSAPPETHPADAARSGSRGPAARSRRRRS